MSGKAQFTFKDCPDPLKGLSIFKLILRATETPKTATFDNYIFKKYISNLDSSSNLALRTTQHSVG